MTDSRKDAASFRAARDFLLRHRDDYDAARAGFSWPDLHEFNWALDWFDVIAAEHPDRTALRIVTPPGPEHGGQPGPGGPARPPGAEAGEAERGTRISYAEMAARSSQVANWLHDVGVRRGETATTTPGTSPPRTPTATSPT